MLLTVWLGWSKLTKHNIIHEFHMLLPNVGAQKLRGCKHKENFNKNVKNACSRLMQTQFETVHSE